MQSATSHDTTAIEYSGIEYLNLASVDIRIADFCIGGTSGEINMVVCHIRNDSIVLYKTFQLKQTSVDNTLLQFRFIANVLWRPM